MVRKDSGIYFIARSHGHHFGFTVFKSQTKSPIEYYPIERALPESQIYYRSLTHCCSMCLNEQCCQMATIHDCKFLNSLLKFFNLLKNSRRNSYLSQLNLLRKERLRKLLENFYVKNVIGLFVLILKKTETGVT